MKGQQMTIEQDRAAILAELAALLAQLPLEVLRIMPQVLELKRAVDELPERQRARVRAAIAEILAAE